MTKRKLFLLLCFILFSLVGIVVTISLLLWGYVELATMVLSLNAAS
ncbi:hypothetical protein [Arcicella rigui]|uniref:NADH dehydrogenase subunit 6 n=1 Tax=Arcicella rigui TaxID=797020 RepID=A0ABU5Q4R2_9BACT|nr:hypothetical protein [Arcicella rigui]MEA5137815.1 hypothetical protein [Arcicella rigui]